MFRAMAIPLFCCCIMIPWSTYIILYNKTSITQQHHINNNKSFFENRYFEAVEEILTKLSDQKLKGSNKASLTRQLKDLDPEGVIKAFIEGGKKKRPDISHLVNRSPKNKGKKSSGAGSLDKSLKGKKKRSKPDTPKKEETTMDFQDEEEEVAVPITPPRSHPPAPVPVSPAAAPVTTPVNTPEGTGNPYAQLISELSDSLEGVVSASEKRVVVEYIEGRLEQVHVKGTAKKLEGAMGKIAERLGDDAYWKEYAEKLDK